MKINHFNYSNPNLTDLLHTIQMLGTIYNDNLISIFVIFIPSIISEPPPRITN